MQLGGCSIVQAGSSAYENIGVTRGQLRDNKIQLTSTSTRP